MVLPRSSSARNQPGYITLLTVIVVSMAALLLVSSAVLITTDGYATQRRLLDSLTARAAAQTCAEVAVSKLKSDLAYTGNETFPLAFAGCEIQTISGSGNTNRTIQTIGTKNNAVKKIRVVISEVNPLTSFNSWQEVADF